MRWPSLLGPRAAAVEPEQPARPMGSAYPGDYDSGHPWRAWHPTARLLAVIAGCLTAVAVAQAAVIVSLFPLKTIEPVFLTIAPETKFAVEAARVTERADALVEMQAAWVRRWAIYRYGVVPDNKTMGERVLWLRQHSAPSVYAEFERDRPKIVAAIKEEQERDIYGISVGRTGGDFWIVEFAMKDTKKSQPTERGRFRLLARIALEPPKDATRTEASLQIDPGAYLLGFTVLSAQLSEVK